MRICFLLLVAAFTFGGIAAAHQPFESSALLLLDGNRFELQVTASVEIAQILASGAVIDSTTLEKLRPQLLQIGRELYEVSVDGKPLPPDRAFFSLRPGEAIFSTVYPLPRPAEVRFRAAYLGKLSPEYAGSVHAYDEKGKLILQNPRLRKKSSEDGFTIKVAAEEVPAASPTPEPAEPARKEPAAAPWKSIRAAAAVLAAIFIAGGIVWAFRRHLRRGLGGSRTS